METQNKSKRCKIGKKAAIFGFVVCVICAVSLAVILYFTLKPNNSQNNTNLTNITNETTSDDCIAAHEQYIGTEPSNLGKFEKAAVAVDSIYCASVGKDVLIENGSAIDAAIATGLCNGLLNPHSMGIGGGNFMLIYLKDLNKVIAIDSRETAPKDSNETMFVNNSALSLKGGLASGIPGEIAGFWEAHKIGGRLPWKRLLKPSIDLCKKGIPVSNVLAHVLKTQENSIRQNEQLSKTFINPLTNRTYNVSEEIIWSSLAKTLEIISEGGYEEFYNGNLSKLIVDENKMNGGIFTIDDLKSYKPAIRTPIEVKLNNQYRLFALPPPSSGLLVSFILNVMSRFNLSSESIKTPEKIALYYHRLIETFKHGYAKRSLLGDEDFYNVTEIMKNLTDKSYIDRIVSLINDSVTFDEKYYSPAWLTNKTDAGTAHISIVAPNGDAVSMTSTINTYFGAMYAGKETGIIYNNEMDDFSTPGTVNFFGVPASEANFIKPKKRPMSSQSPIIVLDENDNVRLVLGASGGTRIITGVAQVALKNLWLGDDIKESIDYPRVHHQLSPSFTQIEKGFPSNAIELLKQRKHDVRCLVTSGSIVQGIERRSKDKFLWANSDFRKGGTVDGF